MSLPASAEVTGETGEDPNSPACPSGGGPGDGGGSGGGGGGTPPPDCTECGSDSDCPNAECWTCTGAGACEPLTTSFDCATEPSVTLEPEADEPVEISKGEDVSISVTKRKNAGTAQRCKDGAIERKDVSLNCEAVEWQVAGIDAEPSSGEGTTASFTAKEKGEAQVEFTIDCTSESPCDSSPSDTASVELKSCTPELTVEKATPCFNSGDSVSVDDFSIDALCCDSEPTLSATPSRAPSLAGQGAPPLKSRFDVTISGTACGENVSDTVTGIPVADKDRKKTTTRALDVANLIQVIQDYTQLLNNLPGDLGCDTSVVEPSAIEISVEERFECCASQGGVFRLRKYSFGFNGEIISSDCSFPFFGAPYVASINVTIKASAGANISIESNETCDNRCAKGSVTPTISGEGGVEVTALGSAIDAELTVAPTFTGIRATWRGSKCEKSGLCFDGRLRTSADITGSVTTFWFWTTSVSSTLIPEQTIENFGNSCPS